MNDRVVIDASEWVRRLMPLEVDHEVSKLWMESFTEAGGQLVAPVFLQIEVAAAISRQTGQAAVSERALKVLDSTDAMRFILLNSALVKASVDVATKLQLRAGDSIYVALARQLDLPLVSWDKEQLQRTASIITSYAPSNYVF